MRPKTLPKSSADDLFRARLEAILDGRHELVRLRVATAHCPLAPRRRPASCGGAQKWNTAPIVGPC